MAMDTDMEQNIDDYLDELAKEEDPWDEYDDENWERGILDCDDEDSYDDEEDLVDFPNDDPFLDDSEF